MNIDRTGLIAVIAIIALLASVTTYIMPGKQGLQGVAGEVGPQGIAGPPGPQGVQGVAGPQGTSGPVGSVGAPGPQGEKGDTGTLQVAGSYFLPTLSSLDTVIDVDESFTIIGTVFFYAPEIFLFDADGEVHELGKAKRNSDNNTIKLKVNLSDLDSSEEVSTGVAEIGARKENSSETYITFPIMIED